MFLVCKYSCRWLFSPYFEAYAPTRPLTLKASSITFFRRTSLRVARYYHIYALTKLAPSNTSLFSFFTKPAEKGMLYKIHIFIMRKSDILCTVQYKREWLNTTHQKKMKRRDV